MKRFLLYISLFISLATQAQFFANQQGGNKPATTLPDFTELDSYFDRYSIVRPTTVFQDVDRTIPATENNPVRSFTEQKNNNHMQWLSSDAVRLSYISQIFGSAYNYNFPIYKYPDGDIPHVVYPNMFDVLHQGNFTGNASPNTVIMVVRRRVSVQDENLSPDASLGLKETSGNVMQVTNSATGFINVTGSAPIPVDVWTIIEIVDNGASSNLRYNNVQTGSNFTLNASTVSAIGQGTISHVYEHDLAFKGIIFGTLTTNRTAVYALLNSLFPIGVRVNKPHAHTITVTFDGTDTFNATATFAQGDDALPANTAFDQWEWIHRTNVPDVNGNTFLDGQKVIIGNNQSSLKRSFFPSYFITPGDGNAWVAARLKRSNTAGRSLSDIPLRSQYVNDNVAGTVDAQRPPRLSTVTINDALRNRMVLVFTGGSGTLNSSSGNANNFTAWVENRPIQPNAISFTANTINLDFAKPFTYTTGYTIPLRLSYTQNPGNALRDTNVKNVENFVTGIFTNITNNIAGPVTGKINLTWFLDTNASGWNNNVGGGFDPATTGTAIANIKDDVGVGANTGISLAVNDAFAGWASNSSSPTNTTYPGPNMTDRGWQVDGATNATAVLRLAGFTANQTVRIQMAIFRDNVSGGGGGLGNITLTGASTINTNNINPLTLQSYDQTINANGSGQIDITVFAQSTNKFMINALIFTRFP